MEITSVIKDALVLKIYINGKLHILLDIIAINGLRSHFITGQNKYFIEICLIDSEKLILEYDKQEKFEQILNLIDEAIK